MRVGFIYSFFSQLVLRAPMDGKVAAVNAIVGKQVVEATKLIVMEDDATEDKKKK